MDAKPSTSVVLSSSEDSESSEDEAIIMYYYIRYRKRMSRRFWVHPYLERNFHRVADFNPRLFGFMLLRVPRKMKIVQNWTFFNFPQQQEVGFLVFILETGKKLQTQITGLLNMSVSRQLVTNWFLWITDESVISSPVCGAPFDNTASDSKRTGW